MLQLSYDVRPIDELIVATDALISELNRATNPDDRDRSLERAVALTKEYQKLADKQPNLPHSEHLREAWKRAEEERDVARMADLLVGLRNRAKELKPSTGTVRPAPGRLAFSELSGPASDRAPDQLRHDAAGRPALPAENTAYLGRSLFTDYLLAVELGGTLLLVATIGAIAIAYRGPTASPRRRLP